MEVEEYILSPPSLDELVKIIQPVLEENYNVSTISVVECPDLRQSPYHLAAEGLGGRECIADIGGQPNIYPDIRMDRRYSMLTSARQMGMSMEKGMVIGAGAAPFFDIGTNAELAANFSWDGSFDDLHNLSTYTKIDKETGDPACEKSPSTGCALMMNLYGSEGLPGPVLKITARGRKGLQKSFTECVRNALKNHYGNDQIISIGGVFLIKSGTAKFHIMPDFPAKNANTQYTFNSVEEIVSWLTFHNFETSSASPIVCLTVFHSTDPGEKLQLRVEHTHCFTADGSNRGGHYHEDLENVEGNDVEYEAYFNTAKTLYRIDTPEVTLKR